MAAVIENFGTTEAGEAVEKITLAAGDIRVSILTWGAVLQSVRLAAVPYNITLGSDILADYIGKMRHHGSLIGPVANRITGAKAVIGGKECQFEVNQADSITLHSGTAGTHRRLWQRGATGADFVELSVILPDGEGGFPANRTITARFEVAAPATLRLTVTAQADGETILNMANHSYWNLDGSDTWSGHQMQLLADHYLPTTDLFTPTGEVLPVEGTAMDFRELREIRAGRDVFDTNFCVAPARRGLTDVLHLRGTSGLQMTIATTEPGLQVYDGRNAQRPGRPTYEGLAFEPQFWPDAPNYPAFPSITLAKDEPWQQISEWRFSR